jgi:hypothetical protein
MNKKLAVSEKIKKDRRNTYENKINLMIESIKELVDDQSVKIMVDQWLIKWTQEMGLLSEEIMKSLVLL